MASNEIEYNVSDRHKKKPSINFQNDKVRKRLFDISLVISNGILNKTISNYEASKYLQEVRKYKGTHLWDNQVTEMTEKLIPHLKRLIYGTYMCFHNYNTRLSKQDTKSDSIEDMFETIDDMIDHYTQNNDYEINPESTGKHKIRGNKKKLKETNKIKKKRVRKANNGRKGRKAQSFSKKIKDDNNKVNIPYTSSVDFQNMLGIKNNTSNNEINKNFTDTGFPNKPKFLKRTYAGAPKSNKCAEFNRCLNKEESYENTNDVGFAIDLSLKPKNAQASITNTLFDIQSHDLFNQCKTANEQHVGNNENLTVLDLSLHRQSAAIGADSNESQIFNENNIDYEKDNESISLSLFRNTKKVSETHSMTYFEQMNSAFVTEPNETSGKENKIKSENDVDCTKISNIENHFCNHLSLPVSVVTEEKDNTKTLIPKTSKRPRRKPKENKEINEEIASKNTNGIKKRGRKKKSISNDQQTMVSKSDNEKTNETVNTKFDSNDAFSWISSIQYIRQIDEDEYCTDLELPDEFWNNYDLPPNWNDNDFNL